MKTFCLLLLFSPLVFSATLEVGPGKRYSKIEDALQKARKGDTIKVHPLKNGEAYSKTALYISKSGLKFIGIGNSPVKISGKGFVYSGRGSVPRAVFQFNKGADDCLVENFDISGASNQSHNGAAVRISSANNITVRKCIIHKNDMGIMSNGDGSTKLAQNQIIEYCHIHHNGNFKEPGYNHNLYLGGASLTVRFCEINNSLTGHNVKSRAHYNRIEYNYIHDSLNREIDLVDSGETVHANSHSVLLGNLIVKDPKCKGNKGTIHFGQDGGKAHNGDIYLIHNTILSSYITPIVVLSHSQSGLQAYGNIFHDQFSNQKNMVLVQFSKGAQTQNVKGDQNLFSKNFINLPKQLKNTKSSSTIKFKDTKKLDYRLSRSANTRNLKLNIPLGPGMKKDATFWQYKHPLQKVKRSKQFSLSFGAFD